MRKLVLLFFVSWCYTVAFAQSDLGLSSYVEGEKLRESGQYLLAIDQYNQAISEDPKNFNFHFKKGMCYYKLRQADNAMESLLKAVELKPEVAEAHAKLGKLYEYKEKVDKSIEHYNHAFKYDDSPQKKLEYKNNILKLLIQLDRLDDTETHLVDILDINPRNVRALYYYAKLMNQRGEYSKAKDAASAGLDILRGSSPKETARFYYEQGYASYHLHEYDQLSDILSKANYGPYRALVTKMTPTYKYRVAKSYFEIYEYEKARELLSDAMMIDNSNPKVHELQIEIAHATTDKSEIIAFNNEILAHEENPVTRAQKHAELAQLYLVQGKYQQAIKMADMCLQQMPEHYLVGYIKAISYYKSENTKKAVDQLKELVKYRGLDLETKAQYNFSLGVIANEYGEWDTAKRALKTARLDNSYRYAATELLEEITLKH
ncbi:tetratricopeptide repeat protein [Sediminitomix flava]|uniref:Tetratricopeptide repeat protein n=1 Tax=Sediminitomix flava TaxID=379075 RepID=A0A315Z181_SEDFL|nr:tetratricopeptide repeat protein [Sediminitomix flava]PWJ36065.1 tetratricopeptide repeat protein [Sediminitomix flava]